DGAVAEQAVRRDRWYSVAAAGADGAVVDVNRAAGQMDLTVKPNQHIQIKVRRAGEDCRRHEIDTTAIADIERAVSSISLILDGSASQILRRRRIRDFVTIEAAQLERAANDPFRAD